MRFAAQCTCKMRLDFRCERSSTVVNPEAPERFEILPRRLSVEVGLRGAAPAANRMEDLNVEICVGRLRLMRSSFW